MPIDESKTYWGMEEVIRIDVIQNLFQPRNIRLQEKELPPEPLGVLFAFDILRCVNGVAC